VLALGATMKSAHFAVLSAPLALLALALVHCGTTIVTERDAPTPVADGGGSVAVDGSPAAVVDAPPAGNKADAGPTLATMAKARDIFAVVNVKAGDIRVFGGNSGAGLDDTTESYSPTANAWTKGASTAPTRRYGHSATADAAGQVYILGGTVNGPTPIAAAEIFSPADGSWKAIADMPTARAGLGAATGKDGRIYAIGGGAPGAPSDVVEAYAPSTQSWSTAATLPTKRFALVAVTGADGKIYAIGGRDAHNVPLATVEVLDTDTGQWSTAASLGTARYWLGATLGADGRIYAVGGIGDLGFVSDLEAFTPAAGWTKLPAMPEARGWLSAGATPDGRVFAVGGSIQSDDIAATQPPPTRTILAFDPKTAIWTRQLARRRRRASCDPDGCRLYVSTTKDDGSSDLYAASRR
jgi:hypothetical protein